MTQKESREELRKLQREIGKTKRHLSSLESKLNRLTNRKGKAGNQHRWNSEDERLKSLKQEIRKQYPGTEFTPESLSLLRFVGTLLYSPVMRDKQDLAEALAREYH